MIKQIIILHSCVNQARRLLDHVTSKGESAAKVVLQYLQRTQESGSEPVNQEQLTPPKGMSLFNHDQNWVHNHTVSSNGRLNVKSHFVKDASSGESLTFWHFLCVVKKLVEK